MVGDFDWASLSDYLTGGASDSPTSDWGMNYMPSFLDSAPLSSAVDYLPSVEDAYPARVFAPAGNNYAEQYGLTYDEPGGSAVSAQSYSPGILETLNGWGKNIDSIMNNGAVKLGIGALGGLAAYMDAKSRKKLQEQELAKLQAQLAGKEAAKNYYGQTMSFANPRAAVGRGNWGATSPLAFTGNGLSRMTGTLQPLPQFAEGGTVSPLQWIVNKLTDPKKTPEQIRAEKIKAMREAEETPEQKAAREREQATRDWEYNRQNQKQMARGGHLSGPTPGQADQIPAVLSDGEYVMDADTVSALGDGNNAAGAGALDKMRQNIRRHKRSAPITKIPPKAKSPEAYLKGTK